MPSAAQIARERERVRRALAYVQRKLETAFDIKLEHDTDVGAEMWIGPRQWPEEPKAFTLGFDAAITADLTTHELREVVLHELLHALTWPMREFGVKGFSEKAAEAWSSRVEEPVVRELTRIISTHALGRWSQR
jgi:hypothetical protein